MVTELALTGRNFDANEAKAIGLVSHVLPDKPSLNSKAEALAVQLACKAPLALMGTKRVLLHARCCSVLSPQITVLRILAACLPCGSAEAFGAASLSACRDYQ